MIDFCKYAKIKDKYCICYFGPSDEYLIQIKLLKPIIEKKFEGLKVFIGCRDDRAQILSGEKDILLASEMRSKYLDFAHIKEIKFNGISHPIEDLIKECEISCCEIPEKIIDHTNICVIVTKGNYPTKNLEERYLLRLKKIALQDGYEVKIDGDSKKAGLVAGVESLSLFEAASRGIKTILVPTGVGTRLYQKFFPKGIVMHN